MINDNIDFYKQCEGCLSYDKERPWVNCSVRGISYIPQGLICPCSTCLLKGICLEICEEFDLFIDELKKSNRNHKWHVRMKE